MASNRYFSNETFTFLKELARNNNKQWFQKNKHRYEEHIKEPAMRFIMDFGPRLFKINKHFTADPRPVGGSLFRIYKDTRFAHDKSPYKINTGIQFRHSQGKDVHAPGYYLHIEPGNIFAAAGIWHPDYKTLGMIRDSIVENPSVWKKASRNKTFRNRFELSGDSLLNAPRGYDSGHPLIEDLRRKDFVGLSSMSEESVIGNELPKKFAEVCRAASSFMRFLCKAIGVPF